jgi:hypothetical protein
MASPVRVKALWRPRRPDYFSATTTGTWSDGYS